MTRRKSTESINIRTENVNIRTENVIFRTEIDSFSEPGDLQDNTDETLMHFAPPCKRAVNMTAVWGTLSKNG